MSDDECPDTIPAPFIGPVAPDEYRCAVCSAVYKYARSDGEARAASEAEWGMPVTDETHDIVCDDCFKDFMRCYGAGGVLTGPGGGDA